jgi:hypothetical protein
MFGINRKARQAAAAATTERHPMIETLEGRQMMSATPVHAAVHVGATPAKPAIVVAAKPVAKVTPVVKPKVTALPAYLPATGVIKGANVIGGWTGTMRLDGTKVDNAFSVNFTFQRGVAATGTFNMGATMNNQVVVSTMVFSLHNNVRVLFATPSLMAGMTGALSSNGKMLTGRFSFNTSHGWQTGMFTLTRSS